MPTNKAVRTLNADLTAYRKALSAEQAAKKQVKTDASQEKAALAKIDAQEKKIIDAFENPSKPLDAATQTKMLNELFTLGQQSVKTQDHFDALSSRAQKDVAKDTAAAKADKKKALKDLKPAEYAMNLKQTNAARKELGLKSVNKVIRPPQPKKPNAAEVARKFLGWTEYKLEPSGKLDMHQWVPKDVDCANFVSGCLEKAGLIPKGAHSDMVTGLRDNLKARGWHSVSLKNAKPGDVVCFDGPDGPFQHVEIFDHWQGKTPVFIGSNNVLQDGTQKITYDVGGTWAYKFHVYAPPR